MKRLGSAVMSVLGTDVKLPTRRSDGMVDVPGLEPGAREGVWVRLPPSAYSVWRSLVALFSGENEVVGSNPTTLIGSAGSAERSPLDTARYAG